MERYTTQRTTTRITTRTNARTSLHHHYHHHCCVREGVVTISFFVNQFANMFVFFLFSVILSLVFVLFFTFICANILTTLTCSKIRASLFFFVRGRFFLFYLLFSSVAKKRVQYKNKLLCLKPHPPPFCVLTQSDSDSDCCPLLNLC